MRLNFFTGLLIHYLWEFSILFCLYCCCMSVSFLPIYTFFFGKKSRFIQNPSILGGWQPPVQRPPLQQFALFRYLEYLLSSVIFVVFCSSILPTFLVFNFNPLIGCFKRSNQFPSTQICSWLKTFCFLIIFLSVWEPYSALNNSFLKSVF